MWLTKKQCGKIVSTQEFLVSPLQGKKNELSLQTVCTLYAHSTPSTCNWSLPSALKIPEEQGNIERKENVSEYHKTSKGSVRFWISNVSYRLICERLGPRSQCYLGKGTETKSWWVAGWNRLLGGEGHVYGGSILVLVLSCLRSAPGCYEVSSFSHMLQCCDPQAQRNGSNQPRFKTVSQMHPLSFQTVPARYPSVMYAQLRVYAVRWWESMLSMCEVLCSTPEPQGGKGETHNDRIL